MNHVIVHLSLVPRVGPATITKIIRFLRYHNQSLASIYTMKAADFHKLGMNNGLAQKIVQALASTELLDQELERAHRHNINIVTYVDNDYPHILHNIHMPPPVLYWRGLPLLHKHFTKSLAVVGSRKSDMYGRTAMSTLCTPVIQNGWTLVSGGAYGIDRHVHELALKHQSPTIVVLGSGLLKLYPRDHTRLFDQIAASSGTIISPFSLQTEPFATNFPARNRIIAGLSRVCLVIQAAAKSGALITARYALEQGREVGAVPGPINSPVSAGCHNLILEGATLIAKPADLLLLLDQTNIQHTSTSDNQPISHAVDVAETVVHQSVTIEDKIVALCVEPYSFDELVEQTGVERTILNQVLLKLQIAGKVTQNSMGLWSHAHAI